jgi:protein involved in polysaccharide export with SLBB domain
MLIFAEAVPAAEREMSPGMGALTGQSRPAQRTPASGLSSESAVSPVRPSGQGSPVPGPGMERPIIYSTAPLYVQGATQYAPRPFTGLPAWMQNAYPPPSGDYPPFGANLFQGSFAGTYYAGLNSDYVIMPGDRILIHIWGAQSYSDTLMVDQQGNIFLPEVGPVPVAGVRNGQLQGTVRSYLASVFKSDMEVYVNLLTAQPVAVYVTGFAARPGRYAGGVNDSVLYYLDRAGGIIPDRGSYRNIAILRGSREVAKVDLYSFILSGSIGGGQLRDGDVIVVKEKGPGVAAGGRIPQHATYEAKGKGMTGLELTRFASPQPSVSHVGVTGTRNALPFNVYLTLREFAEFSLAADDKVEFLADMPGQSIMVSVSGAVTGTTHFPTLRDTSLRTLLAHIHADKNLSNLEGIYIKRRSVMEQQRPAINDGLRRLEKSVLTATSANEESAQIRVQEAQLVRSFAARAAVFEQEGIVVVTRRGVVADILLEDGDEIVIPQRSDVVQINGEVAAPKSVVYAAGRSVSDYVDDAGGFTDRADRSNILVVHPNGEIVKAGKTSILAGDVLLVMPTYEGKGFSIFKDIIQVLYQVAIAARVVLAPW